MGARRRVGRLAWAAGVLLAPGRAQAQGGPTAAMDGQWHFAVTPYMWFTGIKGDVSVKGTAEVPGGDGKVVNLACDGPRAWLSYAW
jgi:hypothetical protein